MPVDTERKMIPQIENLEQYLSGKSREELEEIFAYGEKIKQEGERKKKEFWSEKSRYDFWRLLGYYVKYRKNLALKYEYLDKMSDLEKDKFLEEYLFEDMLYSGKVVGTKANYEQIIGGFVFIRDTNGTLMVNGNVLDGDWMESLKKYKLESTYGMTLDFTRNRIGDKGARVIAENIKLKEGVELDLSDSCIGQIGAKALSYMKLAEGVKVNLEKNKIGDEGIKAIAENMELKEGVELGLSFNKIGDEGAKAIAKNMKLKEGVMLDLRFNEIGDEGAKAISRMELQEGVKLFLGRNEIGDEGAKAIAKNLKLKKGVALSLGFNQIGDEGAKAIMENMELQEGVELNLVCDSISKEMTYELADWERSYINKGIRCKVLVTTF